MASDSKNIPLGELNQFTNSRSKKPFTSVYDTQEKLKDNYYNPDITADKYLFEAIVVERAKKVPLSQMPWLANNKPAHSHENPKDVLVVKAWCPEINRVEHPDLALEDDNGEAISRELILALLPDYIAISSEVSEKGIPDIDDIVLVSRDGKYHGIKEKASSNSGSKKRKDAEGDNTPGFEDANLAPSGDSPVPQPNGLPTTNINQKYPVPTTPGRYPVHKNNIQPYGEFEMVVIQNTSILYPKRYINALEAMRSAYAEQNPGKTLGITSGYRDVNLQRILYSEYIQRLKRPPQVAAPGKSLHNSGQAADLGTGQIYNNKFTNLGLKGQSVKNAVYEKVQNGEFGEVAKWLSINSERFGFVWAGFSFKELWHYELDPSKLPANLKGDEKGDVLF